MIQAAKIIGTGLATTGLIGAGVGIGVVFGALNIRSGKKPFFKRAIIQSYAILGFAFLRSYWSVRFDDGLSYYCTWPNR